MPWKECSAVSCREGFVVLARTEDANMSELCRRFGVSRRTGYKPAARGRLYPVFRLKHQKALKLDPGIRYTESGSS